MDLSCYRHWVNTLQIYNYIFYQDLWGWSVCLELTGLFCINVKYVAKGRVFFTKLALGSNFLVQPIADSVINVQKILVTVLFKFQNDPMGNVLCGVKQSYMFDLLLETRMPHEKFLPYKSGGKLICNLTKYGSMVVWLFLFPSPPLPV